MPFVPIDTDEIAEGKPIGTSVGQKIKDNFDDHQTRIIAKEAYTEVPPIILRVNGPYYVGGAPKTNVLRTQITHDLTITGVRILVDKAGSSGILTVDLKLKRGSNAPVSIFTTNPSIAYTAGDDATSVSGVINPTWRHLEENDVLTLDIVSVQTGGRGFMLRIDYVPDEI